MTRLLLFLALVPSLAFGQVLRRDGANGTFSTAPTFPGATSTSTIATKGLVSTALATPTNATFTAGAGTLPNATYYYRVTALDAAGETLPSTETSLAITTGGVNVNWGAVAGATSYKVYGRSTGAELYMATVTAPTTTWLDAGSVTPSGAMPSLGTSANISTVSGITARDLTTTAASGANAINIASGAHFTFDNGAGAYYLFKNGNYLTANGFSGITTGGTFIADGDIGTALRFTGRTNTIVLRGTPTDGATAVAARSESANTLTTAGAQIHCFRTGTSGADQACIDKDGMLRFGVANTAAAPTCDATQRGKLWIVNGGTGVTDTVTLCLKAAADTYSWVAITTGG